eukprot:m.291675 g.291675  ORF g.291675 m.291675 type:complete len:458 (+) comp12501_c0_seq1:1-1374(+)
MTGFAGTVDGSFFRAPEWVDLKKPPGHTSMTPVYGNAGWWRDYITLNYFIFSPNIVWFAIAVATYVAFPYDLDAAKTFAWPWMLKRLAIWTVMTFGYVAFWNGILYIVRRCQRKFRPQANPPLSRMIHNLYYNFLAIVQWVVWECVFMYIYANDRLPYIKHADTFATWQNALNVVAFSLLLPVWRDFHFYLAHRLLHVRALYKFVHSLHHRNTDIEPFSGLCMHPVEHLYYYSCILPSVFLTTSPFLLYWNAVHLLLSPAASHSGWEDHWQSDQFHYLHHAKFECNYGTSGVPFDKLFGTFRDKLGTSATYKGTATDKSESSQREEVGKGGDSDSAEEKYLRGPIAISGVLAPTKQHAAYNVGSFVVMALPIILAVCYNLPGTTLFGNVPVAPVFAFSVAYGPILLGLLILWLTGDKQSARWPFHKEPLFGTFGLHTLLGWAVTVVPVYQTVYHFLK